MLGTSGQGATGGILGSGIMTAEKNATGNTKNVVYSLSRASRCHNCDKKMNVGEIVKLETGKDETEALCGACAQLDALEMIGKGNAKVTRLATKYSTTSFVVLKWSELWKSYERVGTLVEKQALVQAMKENESKAAK